MPRLFKAPLTLRQVALILGALGAGTMIGFEMIAATSRKLEAEKTPEIRTVTDGPTPVRALGEKLRIHSKDNVMKPILTFGDLTEFAEQFVLIDNGRDNGGKKDRVETGDMHFAFLHSRVLEYHGYQQPVIEAETLTRKPEAIGWKTSFADEPRRIPDDVLLARRAKRGLTPSLPLCEPMKPGRVPYNMRLATPDELITLKREIEEGKARLPSSEIFNPGFTLRKINEALLRLSTDESELSPRESSTPQLR
jgi:hypothetical protein